MLLIEGLAAQTPDSGLVIQKENVLLLDSAQANEIGKTQVEFLDSLARALDPFFNQLDTLQTAISADTADANAPVSGELEMSFSRQKAYLKSDDQSVFNALIIENNTAETIEGQLTIYLPSEWSIIGKTSQQLILQPGQRIVLPLRFLLPKKLIGGEAKVIAATFFKKDETLIRAYTYVELEANVNVVMYAMHSPVYLNPINNSGLYALKIVNRGNTKELLRLDVNCTEGYEISNKLGEANEVQFFLAPSRDTVLFFNLSRTFKVKTTSDLAFGRITSRLTHSVETFESSSLIMDYSSTYNDDSYKRIVPFSIYLGSLNSNSIASQYYGGINGYLLLRNKNNFSYQVGTLNFSKIGQTTLGQGAQYGIYTYGLRLSGSNYHLALSSRIFNRYLPIVGQGLSANYKFKRQFVEATISKSFLPNVYLIDAKYGLDLNRNKLEFGAAKTFANSNYNLFNLRTFASFSLLNRANMGLGAQYYNGSVLYPGQIAANTINKFGYLLSFNTKFGEMPFKLTANYRPILTSSFAGGLLNADSHLKIKSKGSLQQDVTGSYRRVALYNQANINSNVFWRINKRFGNNYLTLAPNVRYIGFDRTNIDLTSERRRTLFAGAQFFARSYISSDQSIGFSFSPTLTRNQYDLFDSTGVNAFSLTSAVIGAYNIGVQYTKSRIFLFSANYISGPYFTNSQFINRADSSFSLTNNNRISINASYRKEYALGNLLGDVRLNGFYNINPQNLSEQLNVSLQNRTELGYGIELYLNAGYYSSKYLIAERDVVSNKSVNINFKLVKYFYWQQKQERFFDLKVLCFEDLNGNGIKDENEEVIPNARIEIVADDLELSQKQFSHAPVEYTITDLSGAAYYFKIPELTYTINIDFPFGSIDLSPINGYEQEIVLDSNQTYYVPFSKNYKMKGKIVVMQSKFSRIEKLNLDKVVITATSEEGQVYRGLSDEFGAYTLSIPKPGLYFVKCQNKFGESFKTANDEIMVDFNGIKVYDHDFVFIEEERKVSFGKQEDTQEQPALNTTEQTNTQPNQVNEELNQLKTLNINQPYRPENAIPKREAPTKLGQSYEEYLKYTVFIGRYKGSVKTENMDYLLDLTSARKNYKLDVKPDGLIISRDFETRDSAEEFRDSLIIQKVCTPSLFGKYNELFVELE